MLRFFDLANLTLSAILGVRVTHMLLVFPRPADSKQAAPG